ncbi:MAG: alpha/beta hydrolase [Lysobacterales bacterium]
MTEDINPQASYVRHITPEGGRLTLWKLNLILRLAVKRTYKYGFDVAAYRKRQAELDPKLSKSDPLTRRATVDCNGVPADWVEVPESRNERVILYIHGGAWFISYPSLHHNLVARLCRLIGARSLVVDYRLAPENRFPAAIDDCWTAWRWLREQGVAAGDIVIAGDSAGGNLSLALLHRIKAAGDPMPACAVLLSPLVDFTLSSPSMLTNEKRDPMFTSARMIGLRHLYVRGEQMLHPFASPLFADFTGLPPLLFQSSESEVLRDESLRAAARAHASGVKVEVELWHGMPHVFQAFSALPQSEAGIRNIADFIRRVAGWV